jgi:hypothetical protein
MFKKGDILRPHRDTSRHGWHSRERFRYEGGDAALHIQRGVVYNYDKGHSIYDVLELDPLSNCGAGKALLTILKGEK